MTKQAYSIDPANTAKASSLMVRSSPRKLNLVAGLIRKMSVQEALLQLTFCKRRVSQEVKKCLQSAIANAENNHNLNIDRLVVSEVLVGKAFVMKRMRPRARGRGMSIHKFYSRITVAVSEIKEVA